MTAIEAPRTLAELEADLGRARLDLEAAEAAEIAASARVDASREGHALARVTRKALLLVQRSLADAQETTEQAKAKVRALDRLAVQERERLANERARAAGRALAGWQAEASALEGRVADLVIATREAFDELDVAYRELHDRSGGRLGSRAKGPATLMRVYGWLMNGLTELGRYYDKPTLKAAATTRGDPNV